MLMTIAVLLLILWFLVVWGFFGGVKRPSRGPNLAHELQRG